MNIQKSVVFIYTNDKLAEREIKKTIPFTVSTKRIKYLGINLAKEVKELYTENISYCWKKLKKIQRDGNIFCVHGLKELTLLKCPYYLKQST